MLDVQNPEIKVDEIMQRIQEKVRLRREQSAPPQVGSGPTVPADSSIAFNQLIAQARDLAQVGVNLPEMSRTHGLKRMIAAPVAKAFLRVAQLITRDQRAFNNAMISALQAFDERLAHRALEIADRFDDVGTKHAAFLQRMDEIEGRIRAVQEDQRAHAARLDQLRTALSLQERRLTLLLEEARRRLPGPLDGKQLETFAAELPHVADARYLGFEDAFRGSREEIKERIAIYVPRLKAAQETTGGAPVLDVGCGRGELLEMLRGSGVKASGVDSNGAAIEKCRELQLDATAGDAFDVLAKVPDGSLGGLTALHVVEHLPFELVVRLLDESLRVLRPGGIVIFETPNPTNVLVGASNFYIDPTHRNPVHPQTLHYLFEARGLVQVETLMLHPFPKEMQLPESGSPVARFLNEHFLGPQDYAVIGRRP